MTIRATGSQLTDDPRRRIPRTDSVLANPQVAAARESMGEQVLLDLVHSTQERARRGEIAPEDVESEVLAGILSARSSSMTPVLNATGVIIHTNLGRAPLSEAACDALRDAAGYVDVEFDLASGTRSRRGVETRAALLRACPAAEEALAVNNGAAALSLVATVLAGAGPHGTPREIVLSRGEMIEIGAGFRLTDLMESTGCRIREVGTTNRTHLSDYANAMGDRTGFLLKIHASNYVISGFTAAASIGELADLAHAHNLPLVVDVGSGLFAPEQLLPNEPTLTSALEAGADIVIASGDKLVGGPQAGIILGKAEWIERIARHPLARAMRADKLLLAALEATLNGPTPPALTYLRLEPSELRSRTETLLAKVRELTAADSASAGLCVVEHPGRVGGGGGAEVPLPGWALSIPERCGAVLRQLPEPIVGTLRGSACLIDLRCIPPHRDNDVARAIAQVLKES